MQINQGETRTLTGTISENIQMASNSKLVLNNATLNGSISGDTSTTVETQGTCSLNGSVSCGNLNIGGNTSIGGNVGGPTASAASQSQQVMLGGTALVPGDWLMTEGGIPGLGALYKHHFMYVGNGEFVSRQRPKGVLLEPPSVYQGKKCWLIKHGGQAAADRARARVGEGGFCLTDKNCEHFCSEVCGLGHHSEQVFVSSGKVLVKAGSVLGNALGILGNNGTFTSSIQGGFGSMGGFSGGISFRL